VTASPRSGPHVVALGGGHGLAVTLQALRRVTDDVTAVVGVSDDGGSSGRLRREFGCIPPGDLRMALAALCGDDVWGRTWARVVQHRFDGSGEVGGHALGNLMMEALWEETDDIVTGLEWMAQLLGAHGRVLPLATQPLDIVAEVIGVDALDPTAVSEVRGQVAVATTSGRVESIRLHPADAPVCAEALIAVRNADAIVMGPGSWYTSVLPHCKLEAMRKALETARAKRICVLNLAPQLGETEHFHLHTHLDVLHAAAPDLRFDVVLVDQTAVTYSEALKVSAERVGAVVEVADIADPESPERHSPDLLAAALRRLLPTRQPAPRA
jgi:uncharacterized cofD-like protein